MEALFVFVYAVVALGIMGAVAGVVALAAWGLWSQLRLANETMTRGMLIGVRKRKARLVRIGQQFGGTYENRRFRFSKIEGQASSERIGISVHKRVRCGGRYNPKASIESGQWVPQTKISWTLPLPSPRLKIRLNNGRLLRRVGSKSTVSWLIDKDTRALLDTFGYDDALKPLIHTHFSIRNGSKGTFASLEVPSQIINPKRPRVTEKHIANIRALCKRIEDTLWAPWESAARRHGLTLDKERAVLWGQCDGIDVRVSVSSHPKYSFEILVHRDGPPGLHIIHHDAADPTQEPVPIHNPLVSRLIHVSGDDPHSVQTLFEDQEWIDNLLPLVHGLPGTEVNESGLIIRCTEKRVDLETLIQQALIVAQGLPTHGTRLQKESLVEASDANKRQRLPLNT